MRVTIAVNKYEKGLVEKWAKERKVKKWEILKEMADFANEEVFKRFFEKEYKLKEDK